MKLMEQWTNGNRKDVAEYLYTAPYRTLLKFAMKLRRLHGGDDVETLAYLLDSHRNAQRLPGDKLDDEDDGDRMTRAYD